MVWLEPDFFQKRTDPVEYLAVAHILPVLTQRKRDVLGDRQTVEERRHLKDESVPRARFRELLVAERRDILSVEKNAPFGRRDEPDHILKKDRLAAAALADNRDRFAVADARPKRRSNSQPAEADDAGAKSSSCRRSR